MFTKLVRYCLMFQLAYFLDKELEMGAAKAGMISSLFDVGGTVGGVVSGFIADRVMGGRSLALSSILLLLTSISIVAFAELSTAGPTVVSAAMCLVGFFIAGPDATLGGGAAKTICEINGEGGLAAKTASGIVNGM